MIAIVLADSSLWVFDADSAVTATTTALAPSSGSGRWLSLGSVASSASRSMNVRGVVYANVADLAAFTVASNDGLTYAEGERVLLANQTTAAQCGVYVVGTVATGTAPLVRAPELPTGATLVNGMTVEVSEGTIWAGSTWKAMATGTAVIGTNDPVFYPRVCKGTATLSAGVKALGSTEGLFLFSTTKSQVNLTLNTSAGTLGTWGYKAAVADRTAGKSGTGALTIRSIDAAGTAATSDTSTVDWHVCNW
jgi:hypothetical protein